MVGHGWAWLGTAVGVFYCLESDHAGEVIRRTWEPVEVFVTECDTSRPVQNVFFGYHFVQKLTLGDAIL